MSASNVRFPEVFQELASSSEVSPALVSSAFQAILSGDWPATQVAGFLVALRLKGETAPVIAAAAGAMRDAMIPVNHQFERLLDTCGTGGDGHGTLNLSTAAAIVVASCGVPVAKHGNRAISSKAGSADVLEALGVPLDVPAERAAGVLRDVGITFLLAPTHHPAMKHAAVARRELGIRSIFNCLGPLANPARATHQLIGAYSDELRSCFAHTLRTLGTRRAWIVRGVDGLDELSPSGVTRVTQLDEGTISEFELRPEDFGLEAICLPDIAGGDAAHNAASLLRIFRNEAHPATPAVLLNAAAALVVADHMSPRDATARAREALASGAALNKLEQWKNIAGRARASSRGPDT